MTTSSGGMPWSPAAETIFFAISSATPRIHRDLVVVREADHGGAVARDDRQDHLEPLVLARHGVHERLALVRAETGLERLDHRGVDAERQVGQALDQRDRLAHQRDLVGQRVADVHVEHVRAARDLLRDVDLELRRSPAWSWAWKAFRPVGLMRSPMMQNDCSAPMTTVLDRDWRTVSNVFLSSACRDAEPLAEPRDAGSRRKLMRCSPATPGRRARVLGELAGEPRSTRASGSAARSQRSIIAGGTLMPGTCSSMKRSAARRARGGRSTG